MIKMLAFVKRRVGLGRQEFLDYWRRDHIPLVAKLPGLRRQSTSVAVAIPGKEVRIDLVAEAWWEDAEQLLAADPSPVGKMVAENLARIADPVQTVSAILSERVVIPPPDSGSFVKYYVQGYRRPDLSLEAFDRYWREEHPKVVTRLAGLCGYVQCPLVPVLGVSPALDGVVITWFSSLNSLRTASRSPEMQAIRADEPRFIAQKPIVGVVAVEE